MLRSVAAGTLLLPLFCLLPAALADQWTWKLGARTSQCTNDAAYSEYGTASGASADCAQYMKTGGSSTPDAVQLKCWKQELWVVEFHGIPGKSHDCSGNGNDSIEGSWFGPLTQGKSPDVNFARPAYPGPDLATSSPLGECYEFTFDGHCDSSDNFVVPTTTTTTTLGGGGWDFKQGDRTCADPVALGSAVGYGTECAKFNAGTQTANTDYFLSLRCFNQELWLGKFKYACSGPGNYLEDVWYGPMKTGTSNSLSGAHIDYNAPDDRPDFNSKFSYGECYEFNFGGHCDANDNLVYSSTTTTTLPTWTFKQYSDVEAYAVTKDVTGDGAQCGVPGKGKWGSHSNFQLHCSGQDMWLIERPNPPPADCSVLPSGGWLGPLLPNVGRQTRLGVAWTPTVNTSTTDDYEFTFNGCCDNGKLVSPCPYTITTSTTTTGDQGPWTFKVFNSSGGLQVDEIGKGVDCDNYRPTPGLPGNNYLWNPFCFHDNIYMFKMKKWCQMPSPDGLANLEEGWFGPVVSDVGRKRLHILETFNQNLSLMHHPLDQTYEFSIDGCCADGVYHDLIFPCPLNSSKNVVLQAPATGPSWSMQLYFDHKNGCSNPAPAMHGRGDECVSAANPTASQQLHCRNKELYMVEFDNADLPHVNAHNCTAVPLDKATWYGPLTNGTSQPLQFSDPSHTTPVLTPFCHDFIFDGCCDDNDQIVTGAACTTTTTTTVSQFTPSPGSAGATPPVLPVGQAPPLPSAWENKQTTNAAYAVPTAPGGQSIQTPAPIDQSAYAVPTALPGQATPPPVSSWTGPVPAVLLVHTPAPQALAQGYTSLTTTQGPLPPASLFTVANTNSPVLRAMLAATPFTTTTTTTTSEMPWGLPWWGWFLICCGILLACLVCLAPAAAAPAALMGGGKKKTKSSSGDVETNTAYVVVDEPDALE